MKVAIAYYSQHHGNTKKLLDAIKEWGDSIKYAVCLEHTDAEVLIHLVLLR